MNQMLPRILLLVAIMLAAKPLISCTKADINTVNTVIDSAKAFNDQSYDDVINILGSTTENLSPQEQYYLAASYIRTGDHARYDHAISLLESAANAEVADAAWELARIYDEGTLGPTDILKALDWYRTYSAITIKNTEIPEYFDANGNSVSVDEMLKKTEKMALAGDIDSQMQLATVYGEGRIVATNLTKALEWYEAAAKNGNENAQLLAGYFYCRGLGTEKSVQRANFWLNKFDASTNCQ